MQPQRNGDRIGNSHGGGTISTATSSTTPPKRSAPAKASEAPPKRWIDAPGVRIGVSLLLALHVAAVFIAPISVPPSSDLFASLRALFRPYLDTAYLNHGYGFFSPNPSSCFIVRYQIERRDGQQINGVFPDLKEHWPRLRYHRHFMLTSQVRMFDGLPEAYLKHLQKAHDARFVRLEYVEHRPASIEQVREGIKLDDPRSYSIVGVATINDHGQVDVRVIDPTPVQPSGAPAPYRNVEEAVPAIVEPINRGGGYR